MKVQIISSLAISLAGACFAAPIYTIADLGSLGGATSAAFALNSTGQAVGWAATPSGYTEALEFSAGSPQNLLTGTNWTAGRATGINDAGQITGTVYENGVAHGVVWTNGNLVDLGANTSAAAINSSGQVAASGSQAFLYAGGAQTGLGLLGGGTWTLAEGLNDAGAVVGYGDAGGQIRGFVWTSSGGLVELATVGGQSSYGMAINDGGVVAGTAANASGYLNAARWQNGAVTDLGTLGGSSSYAWGINSSGEIVGSSWLAGNQITHAYVDIDGVMLDLNSLLSPANSGWVLTAAYGINASGQIVGEGMLNGQPHAFLLTDPPAPGLQLAATIPEPATFLLAGAALCCLGVLRMRFSRPR